MNLHANSFTASGLQRDFAALMLGLGIIKPPRVRELRRWELREQGKLPPHNDLKMKTKRLEQRNRIAAKKRAAEAIKRRHSTPTPSAIRRELRDFPYVYF